MSANGGAHRHDPVYGAPMSYTHINYVISSLYPNYSANITEAPRSASSSSRLYFLEIGPNLPSSPSSVLGKPYKAVLKVCGLSLNSAKIQNEVAALFLLARYCPSVPVPRVMAWSEDGQTITTLDQRIPYTNAVAAAGAGGDGSLRPWILITQPPGRGLTRADLDSSAGHSIIAQIARHNATWRTSVPSEPKFGNIRFRQGARPLNSLPPHETLTIQGFLQSYRPVVGPINTTFDYYRYMLKDRIQKVMSSRPYDDVRCDLVPLVAEFIERDLLYISCVRPSPDEEGERISPVFSNMDLSPRNILVEDGPNGQVTVTGILGFEFAAFLPEIDEFVNEVIRHEGSWADRHYRMLLNELARLGCRVPPIDGLASFVEDKFTEQEWAESCLLWKLIDYIAPAQVVEGSADNLRYIERGGRVVRNSIDKLKWLGPQRGLSVVHKGLVVNSQMVTRQQQLQQQQQSQTNSQTEWQLPRRRPRATTTTTTTTTTSSPSTPTPTSATTTTSPSATGRTVLHPREL